MIKGHAKIELTNVTTGEIETVEEDNIVTNAIPELLNDSMAFMLSNTYQFHRDKFFPIYNHLLGGVVMFPGTIEEDPAKYWPSYEFDATGFASNCANSGTDTRRGSFNPNESCELTDDNGKRIGYKYVWDFTTSQANGEIACVCLTHPKAGYNWYGCKDSGNKDRLVPYINGRITCFSKESSSWYLFSRCFFYDKNGYVYSWNDEGEIIKSSVVPCGKIGLFDIIPGDGEVGYPELFFTKAYDISNTTFWTASSDLRYKQFIQISDDEAMLIYSQGSSSSPTSVTWAKVNFRTGEITEGSWTIQAPLSWANTRVTCSMGYLFWVANDFKSVYKIDLNNVSNITQIKVDGIESILKNDNANAYQSLISAPGGAVLGSNFYIINDKMVSTVDFVENQGNYYNRFAGIHIGAFMFYWNTSSSGSSGYYAITYMSMFPQYLATINNLSQPVTKTADKTMKITYTITETE